MRALTGKVQTAVGAHAQFREWGSQGMLKFHVWPSYQPCEAVWVGNIIPLSPWGNSPKQVESYPGLQNQSWAEQELESKISGFSPQHAAFTLPAVPGERELGLFENCFVTEVLPWWNSGDLKQYCEILPVSVVRYIFSIWLFFSLVKQTVRS